MVTRPFTARRIVYQVADASGAFWWAHDAHTLLMHVGRRNKELAAQGIVPDRPAVLSQVPYPGRGCPVP